MRKLKLITKQTVLNAIEFISDKTGEEIYMIELCYIVSSGGVNALTGINFRDKHLKIRCFAGLTDDFMREHMLTGDKQLTIYSPISSNIKLSYSFCSINWDFQEELEYQKKRGNTLVSTPTKQDEVAFENAIICDVKMGFSKSSDNPEIYDCRYPNKDSKRLIDLITLIDYIGIIDKQTSRFSFGRQRFTKNQFIDYICKNTLQ